MSKHLQTDMEYVYRELLSMSAMVEEMIDLATRALMERRSDLAAEVIAGDEQIDQREVRIEEECLKMLALHQPVAIDMRRIATVLKVNNELERIADLAVNLAVRSESLNQYPRFPIPALLTQMVNVATQMVRSALDAFVNLDSRAARRLILLDDEVDRFNREIIDELQHTMQTQPELVSPALHCFSASRHVERIADHATNIAEDVIYLVEGEIVRHQRNESEPSESLPQTAR